MIAIHRWMGVQGSSTVNNMKHLRRICVRLLSSQPFAWPARRRVQLSFGEVCFRLTKDIRREVSEKGTPAGSYYGHTESIWTTRRLGSLIDLQLLRVPQNARDRQFILHHLQHGDSVNSYNSTEICNESNQLRSRQLTCFSAPVCSPHSAQDWCHRKSNCLERCEFPCNLDLVVALCGRALPLASYVHHYANLLCRFPRLLCGGMVSLGQQNMPKDPQAPRIRVLRSHSWSQR
jgi:hypothetical protein